MSTHPRDELIGKNTKGIFFFLDEGAVRKFPLPNILFLFIILLLLLLGKLRTT